VTNHSRIARRSLVVYVLSLLDERVTAAGRVAAAGRAVLLELAAGASAHFQAFLIGDPRGGKLQASAPASTAG
jgi:hypothetical protein